MISVMKTLLLTCLVILITNHSGESLFLSDKINVPQLVNYINNIPGLSWKADSNGFKKRVHLSELKSGMGLLFNYKNDFEALLSESSTEPTAQKDDLPESYDCRTAYPQCTTISSIKDQSECGSCWAVAVASVFSDRLCINSNGKVNYNMSADQLLACDKESEGCNGGYLDTAWKYIEENGLVTGGDYGSNEGCRPYSIPPKKENNSGFESGSKTPECGNNADCPINYKAHSITKLASNEYEIRKYLHKYGPISTGFTVYLSFRFYKNGIYEKLLIDLPLSNHAVRVIGWGEENGKKFWLVANSWGRKWGENGTFRIRRGTDECEFESHMIAGLPKL